MEEKKPRIRSKSQAKRIAIQTVSSKGVVFKDTYDNRLFMVRCPKCEKENWALAVANGECAWCFYKAVDSDVNREPNDPLD